MFESENIIEQSKDKSLKIVELQGTIRKLRAQNTKKDQRINSLEILLKQRTQKINKLNIEYCRLQQQVIQQRSIKINVQQQRQQIQELYQIIQFQQQQISNYLTDQKAYITFVQNIYQNNEVWFEERNLLYEYRTQLQNQIQQIQNTNQILISEKQHFQIELNQQNQQGQDLLGQIQYMIECCEGVA